MAIDHDNSDSFSQSLIRQFDKRRTRLHAEMEQLGVSRFYTSIPCVHQSIYHMLMTFDLFSSIDIVFASSPIRSAVIAFTIAAA